MRGLRKSQKENRAGVVVVGTTLEDFAVVRRVSHDAKDVGLEAVSNNAACSGLSSQRRGTADCGVVRPFAVVWDEKTRRRAMNPKRDYAADHGAKKTSSIIFFRSHLYPNQPTDPPSHNRRLMKTPCTSLATSLRRSTPLADPGLPFSPSSRRFFEFRILNFGS